MGLIVGLSRIDGDVHTHAFLSDGAAMRDLGTLGGQESAAYGINNFAQVVGAAELGSGFSHAFLYDEVLMRDLGTLGGPESGAMGINDAGQVTGWADTPLSIEHAFRYDATGMHDLGSLGGNSEGQAINSQGQVAGWSEIHLGTEDQHAFFFDSSSMQDLGTLGGRTSTAYGLNDAGLVVGFSNFSPGNTHFHAFLFDGSSMNDLGTLGGMDSQALGINNAGQVVGWSYIQGGPSSHAFLYDDTGMQDLNNLIPEDSGWQLGFASGINDHGQIVGQGSYNGQLHAFLLTPETGPGGAGGGAGNGPPAKAAFGTPAPFLPVVAAPAPPVRHHSVTPPALVPPKPALAAGNPAYSPAASSDDRGVTPSLADLDPATDAATLAEWFASLDQEPSGGKPRHGSVALARDG
jgi:probable HAF family extracellular repeat protein